MLKRLSPYRKGHQVKIRVQCADKIVKLLVLNILCGQNITLNIQILTKITRPHTVPGKNIPFNRPVQI